MTDSGTVTAFIEGYLKAWTSNDPADIRAIFTEEAEYRTEPWDEPSRGHDGIVTWWTDSADEPEDWTFDWHPLALDGDRAVIEGRTPYASGRIYRNIWVIDFASDGRAARFVEWYMKEPAED